MGRCGNVAKVTYYDLNIGSQERYGVGCYCQLAKLWQVNNTHHYTFSRICKITEFKYGSNQTSLSKQLYTKITLIYFFVKGDYISHTPTFLFPLFSPYFRIKLLIAQSTVWRGHIMCFKKSSVEGNVTVRLTRLRHVLHDSHPSIFPTFSVFLIFFYFSKW